MWEIEVAEILNDYSLHISPGISYSYFTCHFLVHPITSLSLPLLSLLCALSLFSPSSSTILFLAVLSPLCFSFGWGAGCRFQLENKRPEQIRRCYNALLVQEEEGPGGAETDGKGWCMWRLCPYLSSSPLSLITAISFSELPCLHQGFRKAIVFSCHRLVRVGAGGREGKKEILGLFPTFSHSLPPRISLPLLSSLTPNPSSSCLFSLCKSGVCVCVWSWGGSWRETQTPLPPVSHVLYIH